MKPFKNLFKKRLAPSFNKTKVSKTSSTIFIVLLLLSQFIMPVMALTVVEIPYLSDGITAFASQKPPLDDDIIYVCEDKNWIYGSEHHYTLNKTHSNMPIIISTEFINVTWTQNVTWSFLWLFTYDWDLSIKYENESGEQEITDNGSKTSYRGWYHLTINLEEDMVRIPFGIIFHDYELNNSVVYPSNYVHCKNEGINCLGHAFKIMHEDKVVEEFYLGQLHPIFRLLYGTVGIFIDDEDLSILQLFIFFSQVFIIIFFILKYLILSPIYILVIFQGISLLYSVANSDGNYMTAMKIYIKLNIEMAKAVSLFVRSLFTIIYQLIEGLKFW